MPLERALDLPLGRVLACMQARILRQSTYCGIPTVKQPLDLWVYQELLWELGPDALIEIGTRHGGSALALAHLCDAVGTGRAVSIDVAPADVPERVRAHPRITLLEGDAVALAGSVAARVAPGERVLVIEDSAHTYANTLGVLRAYGPLVTPGSYT